MNELAVSDQSPLEQLSAKVGVEFEHLVNARLKTQEGLELRQQQLSGTSDADLSVVMMGSWGRREVTSESDDDFMALVEGVERETTNPDISAICEVLDVEPGEAGYFGCVVGSEDLVNNIGLDDDSVQNLTRRLLLLLESVPITNATVHENVERALLGRYLSSAKDFRPPRFLLNDIVRYWRTICVDFAGKHKETNEKWGLRNAKLRTYRKALFAGGLLPVLECSRVKTDEMEHYLIDSLATPPIDRIAASFLQHDLPEAGARCIAAYDTFVGRIDDSDFRSELAKVVPGNKNHSAAFREARELGQAFEAGLLALLFETDLKDMVREYLIF